MHQKVSLSFFPVQLLCASFLCCSSLYFILANRETVDLLLNSHKGAQIVLKLKTNNTAWAM